MPKLGVLEVCSSISPHGQKRHRSFVDDGLALAVIGRCALGSGWAEEEFRRVKINFFFENFEGQDEIISEASAFLREQVELTKPKKPLINGSCKSWA